MISAPMRRSGWRGSGQEIVQQRGDKPDHRRGVRAFTASRSQRDLSCSRRLNSGTTSTAASSRLTASELVREVSEKPWKTAEILLKSGNPATHRRFRSDAVSIDRTRHLDVQVLKKPIDLRNRRFQVRVLKGAFSNHLAYFADLLPFPFTSNESSVVPPMPCREVPGRQSRRLTPRPARLPCLGELRRLTSLQYFGSRQWSSAVRGAWAESLSVAANGDRFQGLGWGCP
jgi:hypothetical protein